MMTDTVTMFRGQKPFGGEDVRELREQLLDTQRDEDERGTTEAGTGKGAVWRTTELGQSAEISL